jgi:hypothetical protein
MRDYLSLAFIAAAVAIFVAGCHYGRSDTVIAAGIAGLAGLWRLSRARQSRH